MFRRSIWALNRCHFAFSQFGTVPYFCYNSLKNAPIELIFEYDAYLKQCYKLYQGRFLFSRFREIGQGTWPGSTSWGEKNENEYDIKLVTCEIGGQIAVF